jgi:hypothetical protein
MLTACTRKTCSICGSFHGSKGKCPVETLNAQQEARAGIASGDDLTNRHVRALRELWLMPAKDDKPPMSGGLKPEPMNMQPLVDLETAVGQLRAKWGARA